MTTIFKHSFEHVDDALSYLQQAVHYVTSAGREVRQGSITSDTDRETGKRVWSVCVRGTSREDDRSDGF